MAFNEISQRVKRMCGALEYIEKLRMLPQEHIKQWHEARDYFESEPKRLDVYSSRVSAEHSRRYNAMHSTLAISAARFFVSQKVSGEERRHLQQDFGKVFHRFYSRAYEKPAIKLKKRE